MVDYVVNSEMGTAAELAGVRALLNGLGVALMLDFVPNHSAVDSPWTSADPEYYVNAPRSIPCAAAAQCGYAWPPPPPPFPLHGDIFEYARRYDPANYIKVPGGATLAYGRDPYDGAWTDVVQLNYWNPTTRAAMTGALRAVAAAADMARCDMAMLQARALVSICILVCGHHLRIRMRAHVRIVCILARSCALSNAAAALQLNDVIAAEWGDVMAANGYGRPATEFWADALAAVRAAFPAFRTMAEVYNYGLCPAPEDVTLQGLGIDYTYNKNVLDLLKANNLDALRGCGRSGGGGPPSFAGAM